jgi:hypothetical protein
MEENVIVVRRDCFYTDLPSTKTMSTISSIMVQDSEEYH